MKRCFGSSSTLFRLYLLVGVLSLALPVTALSQIKVGLTLSITGAAAPLGVPQRNTVVLLPREVGGQTIEYIVRDDGSDAARAVKNLRQLLADDGVDVVLGSSTAAASLAMVDAAGEAQVPLIDLAGAGGAVEPLTGARRWVYEAAPTDGLVASALVGAMRKQHVRTLGFIGFADARGQNWLKEISRYARENGIRVVATERYDPSDSAVAGQVARLIAAHPDAILIAAAGRPAILPQHELKSRGYKGIIYQTPGAANRSVLHACGRDCNGLFLAASPLLVAGELLDENPVKKTALRYKRLFEARYGAHTAEAAGGYVWDAGQLVAQAIPAALKMGAKPGTLLFRAALRDALENIRNFLGSQGAFTMSPTDHVGLGARGCVIVEVVDGRWTYRPDL